MGNTLRSHWPDLRIHNYTSHRFLVGWGHMDQWDYPTNYSSHQSNVHSLRCKRHIAYYWIYCRSLLRGLLTNQNWINLFYYFAIYNLLIEVMRFKFCSLAVFFERLSIKDFIKWYSCIFSIFLDFLFYRKFCAKSSLNKQPRFQKENGAIYFSMVSIIFWVFLKF